MWLKTLIGAGLLAAAIAAGTVQAREDAPPAIVDSQALLVEDFAGDPSKEVVSHVYHFPAGSAVPWHIHPDAHEVVYVEEGEFTMEVAGEGKKSYKHGESFYLAPNLVHRGLNQGPGPVKIFVARIKPKAKPLVEEVPPPPD
ncbi:MAG: cupin domain-containing protein [Phycisphaeraceae bacterium]